MLFARERNFHNPHKWPLGSPWDFPRSCVSSRRWKTFFSTPNGDLGDQKTTPGNEYICRVDLHFTISVQLEPEKKKPPPSSKNGKKKIKTTRILHALSSRYSLIRTPKAKTFFVFLFLKNCILFFPPSLVFSKVRRLRNDYLANFFSVFFRKHWRIVCFGNIRLRYSATFQKKKLPSLYSYFIPSRISILILPRLKDLESQRRQKNLISTTQRCRTCTGGGVLGRRILIMFLSFHMHPFVIQSVYP